MGIKLPLCMMCIFALVLSIALLSAPAFAEQVVIFGPAVYTKEIGKPVTFSDSFVVPRDVNNVRIIVKNGTAEAGEVKNLSVSLNGAEVVATGDVRATQSTDKTINYRLNSANALSVTLKGQGGNAVSVAVVGERPDPPQGPISR